MFQRFIAISGKRRWLIPIPLPTRLISVWFISLITSVPTPIARALIQGLKHDLPADGRPLQALIPQRLHTFDQAVTATLQRELEVVDSADWGYDPAARSLAPRLRLLPETGRLRAEYRRQQPGAVANGAATGR